MTQTAENNTVEEEILSWQSFSEILSSNSKDDQRIAKDIDDGL
jgi:hypothetical protein